MDFESELKVIRVCYQREGWLRMGTEEKASGSAQREVRAGMRAVSLVSLGWASPEIICRAPDSLPPAFSALTGSPGACQENALALKS